MRSKAHFKSHPLHPILVSLPIGFFIGAFAFDFLFIITGNFSFWETGYYLSISGIVGAVLAAVPGTVDYFYTVPPESSAKKRATKHAILNITNLLLFVIAVLYRRGEMVIPLVVLFIELTGLVLMSIAGWLGGTLVHRNQIGVDHRYAHAGKWNEIHIHSNDKKLDVGSTRELKINGMKLVHVNKERIVIARTENEFVDFSDHCTHRGGSLAGGIMICGTVHCPWHGSHFDVHTGNVKAGPAEKNIRTYSIEIQNDHIYLLL